MRETIVRIRAEETGEDRYHNPVYDWDGADRLDITGCSVSPRTEGEDTTRGREGVVIGFAVRVRRTVDVVATDRVEVRGETYQVDGEPADWRSPHTNRRGTEILLRRVEG